MLKACRDQHFHPLAYNFLTTVSEELFHLRIDHNDGSVLAYDHHAIRRGLEQTAESLLALSALDGVLHRGLLLADQLLLGFQVGFSNATQGDIDQRVHAVHGRQEIFRGISVCLG